MNIKEWRPQVLVGMVVLCVMAWVAMQNGLDQIAGVCAGGVVAAVTALSTNSGTNSP